jgi:hypothetical protein
MKIITICSSIRNIDTIRSTIQGLEQHGIRGLFPNIEFQPEGTKLSVDEMKKLQKDHFSAIESSEAIYVINPDGYIGTKVTAEIGYALGQNKSVFYSEESGKTELDALSTGIISLNNIQDLKEK